MENYDPIFIILQVSLLPSPTAWERAGSSPGSRGTSGYSPLPQRGRGAGGEGPQLHIFFLALNFVFLYYPLLSTVPEGGVVPVSL